MSFHPKIIFLTKNSSAQSRTSEHVTKLLRLPSDEKNPLGLLKESLHTHIPYKHNLHSPRNNEDSKKTSRYSEW